MRYATPLQGGQAHHFTDPCPTGLYNNRYPRPLLQLAAHVVTDLLCADWVQDASREQARRKTRQKRAAGLYDRGQQGWRYRLWASYDAAQGWIVVTIIGAAIGLNAAFLNIATEWLSDIKLGYCTTAFYLNENFCCWGEDNGEYVGVPCRTPCLLTRVLRMSQLASVDGLWAVELLFIYHIRGTYWPVFCCGWQLTFARLALHSQPLFSSDPSHHMPPGLEFPKSNASLRVSS